MPQVIKVENLSKAYQLGYFGTGTLSRDLERYWSKIRGKEDPFIKIGETNDRTVKGESDIIWSLKDVSFDIEQGDAVGIIGRNGAGKSTLLKILSRVTAPTTGSLKVKGRIASLLEVGTGFHPELSGRENIFLNGAILGMRKAELKRKFDEIVDFSGVERYIDTPVKRYSSGMYVRLAFAVAAYLESEILIVDEVLAVGDTEFQKKCLGKMNEVSKGEGRTVLFVSHNLEAVRKLCKTGIVLEKGNVNFIGSAHSAIDNYLRIEQQKEAVIHIPLPQDAEILPCYAYKIQIEDTDGNISNQVNVGGEWQVRVFFKLNKASTNFITAIGLVTHTDLPLVTTWSKKRDLEAGNYEALFSNNQLILSPGGYTINLGLSIEERTFHYVENVISFTINDVAAPELNPSIIRLQNVGLLLNPMDVAISPLPAPGSISPAQ
ncbi:ABC transporter ATP-binding protein [Mucilaginibacter koreensis]